jgi:adenylate kinase
VKVVIVIGPPGSGKDTQIEELRKKFDFTMISGGDISREIGNKNSKLKERLERGEFLDDEIVMKEVEKELAVAPRDRGLVFDGIPRTLHQAEMLSEVLTHSERTLDAVIYIELEESEIVKRLTRRKVCSLCGKNLSVGAEKCSCGGRAVTRPDDEPATIMKRVQTFLERTLPLVSYYRNKGILIEIDGDQKVSDVAHDIEERLGYVEKR